METRTIDLIVTDVSRPAYIFSLLEDMQQSQSRFIFVGRRKVASDAKIPAAYLISIEGCSIYPIPLGDDALATQNRAWQEFRDSFKQYLTDDDISTVVVNKNFGAEVKDYLEGLGYSQIRSFVNDLNTTIVTYEKVLQKERAS